jgi:hypothetical protein
LDGKWQNLQGVESLEAALAYAQKRNMVAGKRPLNDTAGVNYK